MFIRVVFMPFPFCKANADFFANYFLWENGSSTNIRKERGIKNICLTSEAKLKRFHFKRLTVLFILQPVKQAYTFKTDNKIKQNKNIHHLEDCSVL